jgi:hypothetical protein
MQTQKATGSDVLLNDQNGSVQVQRNGVTQFRSVSTENLHLLLPVR